MFHEYVKLLINNSRRISDENLAFKGNVSQLSSGFPQKYKDLEVRIGFGKGNWANVTWIGFLTEGQTIQTGIYPVYLYYRDKDVLILAYGISETNKPNIEWPVSDVQTVRSHFEEHGLSVNKYTQSLVYKAYSAEDIENISDDFDQDLDYLIDFYKTFMNTDTENPSVNDDPDQTNVDDQFIAFQTIYFGSPGTGKSHNIKDILLKSGIDEEKGINTKRLFRTTFHPDTDYSSFVGCYKPVCEHNSPTIKDIAELQLEAQALMTEIAKKPRAKVEMLSRFMKDNAESLLKAENDANGWTPLLNLIFSTGYVSSDSYLHCLCKIVAEMREQHSSSITYKFTPQVFTQAYIEAWKLWEDAGKTANEKQVFLIIEEINRGNCAQVFGDLFQLLDRKDTGYSEYNVKAEIDLAQYLESILKKGHNGIKDGNLCLPPNLYILATMNTSDQSLFPMDSAFKRRWEWQYVPTKVSPNPKDTTTLTTKVYIKDTIEGKDNILINYDFKNRTIDFGDHEYAWSDFLKAINRRIREATKSDDKLLGYWFVKGDTNGNISISTFVSKVIFYLWNDVFKEYGARDMNPFCITAIDEQSKQTYKTTMSFNQFFDENTGNINIGVVHTFMGNIGLIPDISKEIKKVQDEIQSREGAPRDIENK